jgi:hypothetical protein
VRPGLCHLLIVYHIRGTYGCHGYACFGKYFPIFLTNFLCYFVKNFEPPHGGIF